MIPKYAFEVIVDYTYGNSDHIKRHIASTESIGAAMAIYEQNRNKPNTRRVQVKCILEDWSKTNGVR